MQAVALTPDGKRAVSASYDRTLKVWELDSGRLLRTLEGHKALVNAVALTPDGKRAVSASFDRTLKIWELDSGRLTAHPQWGMNPGDGGGPDPGREAGRLRPGTGRSR